MSCLSVSSCLRKQKNTTHLVELLMILISVWKQRTRAHLSRKIIPETSTHRKRLKCHPASHIFSYSMDIFPWYSQKPSSGKYVKLLCFQLVISLIRNSFKAQPKLCCTQAYTSILYLPDSEWGELFTLMCLSIPSSQLLSFRSPCANLDYGLFIPFLLGDS